MGSYVLRRVLLMVPVLLGTTFVIYAAVYALPGDPVQALAGPDHVVTPATAAAIKEHYHLGDPFLGQYWHYLLGVWVVLYALLVSGGAGLAICSSNPL